MKLFSATNPDYYIEVVDGKINTDLLKLATQSTAQQGVEREISNPSSIEVLEDALLTFQIDHAYARWLQQYLPLVSRFKEGEDQKLPDAGYWKNNRFQRIERKKQEKTEGLLHLKPNQPVLDFVSFDVETTGVVTEVDRIIQIAAVKYRNGEEVATFDRFIQPDNFNEKDGDFYLSDFIVDFTGIKDTDLENAPDLKTAAPDFLDFINGEILVGHNLKFDLDILTNELERNGLVMSSVSYYDTYVEAKEWMPFQPRGGYKLENLKEKIGMEDLRSHDALNDCYMAGELFKHLQNIVAGG